MVRVNGCMFFRISMTIFWKIDVSKEGVVKPTLELLLKMTDQGKTSEIRGNVAIYVILLIKQTD